MKTALLIIAALVAVCLDVSAQGVVRSRTGTNGQNDLWLQEIVTSRTVRDTDTVVVNQPMQLTGTAFDAGNDTNMRFGIHAYIQQDTANILLQYRPMSNNSVPLATAWTNIQAATQLNPGTGYSSLVSIRKDNGWIQFRVIVNKGTSQAIGVTSSTVPKLTIYALKY